MMHVGKKYFTSTLTINEMYIVKPDLMPGLSISFSPAPPGFSILVARIGIIRFNP
jgi:hypothetical protein